MSISKRHCVPDFVTTLRINLAIDIWRPPVKSILVKNSPRVYTALEPNPGEGRKRTLKYHIPEKALKESRDKQQHLSPPFLSPFRMSPLIRHRPWWPSLC